MPSFVGGNTSHILRPIFGQRHEPLVENKSGIISRDVNSRRARVMDQCDIGALVDDPVVYYI